MNGRWSIGVIRISFHNCIIKLELPVNEETLEFYSKKVSTYHWTDAAVSANGNGSVIKQEKRNPFLYYVLFKWSKIILNYNLNLRLNLFKNTFSKRSRLHITHVARLVGH